MERAPYRRYRDTAHEMYDEAEPSDPNEGLLGETLILQGIISGIILVVVTLVSIVSLSVLEPVQVALAETLSGPTTPAALINEARQFGTDTLGWQWLE
ncbi:MAG: hypothetical protein FWC71_11120 [Defluviitaleaceae bacterium]|nr:hypothetical protein [Defluviitaleaceae bacterium]